MFMETGMSVNPSQTEPEFFGLEVARKEALASDIWLFELRDPAGAKLPPYSAGAHLTVMTPGGARRNYSLCGDPADRGAYRIAVKRDANGRGGSLAMADQLLAGQTLQVSLPRNNFELAERAGEFIFVAGGIGITPILSMMRHLKSSGQDKFRLYYCTRDAEATAFLETIQAEFAGQAEIHHDYGDIGQALDLWPVFEKPSSAHVYCCGPKGLMDSVADMSGHWPSGNVHFESFGVDAKAFAENSAFRARLARSGQTIEVAATQTLLEALRAADLRVPSSCESGTCGSCKTRLLGGIAEHRDMVLAENEKNDFIMVCVSRALSPELELDL
jgi:phthalate 4,5-dioxygenase reductase subunit